MYIIIIILQWKMFLNYRRSSRYLCRNCNCPGSVSSNCIIIHNCGFYREPHSRVERCNFCGDFLNEDPAGRTLTGLILFKNACISSKVLIIDYNILHMFRYVHYWNGSVCCTEFEYISSFPSTDCVFERGVKFGYFYKNSKWNSIFQNIILLFIK